MFLWTIYLERGLLELPRDHGFPLSTEVSTTRFGPDTSRASATLLLAQALAFLATSESVLLLLLLLLLLLPTCSGRRLVDVYIRRLSIWMKPR